MAIVFKLSEFDPTDFNIALSPLAEMMALLHVMAEPDHHLEARSSLVAISGSIDDEYLREFNFLSPLWARFRCRLFFPLTARSQTLEKELEAVESLSNHAFIWLCAEGVQGMRGPVPSVDKLLQDSPERQQFLEYCLSRSTARHDLAIELLTDPDSIRQRLLQFLDNTNQRFFQREWKLVRDEIRSAVDFHRHQATAHSIGEALSKLHYSAEYNTDLNEVRFDKLQQYSASLKDRTVIAVPSVRIGPHLTVKWEPGLPIIVHFPLRPVSAEPLGIEGMRRRLAALNSESRLELFRHLVGEPITTSELASRLSQSPAQISRELRTLRDSGFLVSERRGKLVFHRIDIDKIVHLGSDLLSIILR